MLSYLIRWLFCLALRDAAGDPKPDPKPEEKPEKSEKKPEEKPDDFDKDRALATIKAQREAEKALKAQLKEAEGIKAELEKLQAEKLSEQEKTALALTKALEQTKELQAKLEVAEAKRRAAILLQAVQATGLVVDAELSLKALDPATLLDENGEPKGVKEALEKLIKEKPFLAAKPNGSGHVSPTPRAATAAERTAAEDQAARARFARSIRAM